LIQKHLLLLLLVALNPVLVLGLVLKVLHQLSRNIATNECTCSVVMRPTVFTLTLSTSGDFFGVGIKSYT
jgi:hypothetical protein